MRVRRVEANQAEAREEAIMECPYCGFYHLTPGERCARCRKPLFSSAREEESPPLPESSVAPPITAEKVAETKEAPLQSMTPLVSSPAEISPLPEPPRQEGVESQEPETDPLSLLAPAETESHDLTNSGQEWEETTEVLDPPFEESLAVEEEKAWRAEVAALFQESANEPPAPIQEAESSQSLAEEIVATALPPELKTGSTWNEVSLPGEKEEGSSSLFPAPSSDSPEALLLEAPNSEQPAAREMSEEESQPGAVSSPEDLLSLMGQEIALLPEEDKPQATSLPARERELLDSIYDELFVSSEKKQPEKEKADLESKPAASLPQNQPLLAEPANKKVAPARSDAFSFPGIKEPNPEPSLIRLQPRSVENRAEPEVSASEFERELKNIAGSQAQVMRGTEKNPTSWKESMGLILRRLAAGATDLGIWVGMGVGLFKVVALMSGFGSFHGTIGEWALLVVLPLLTMVGILALIYGALFGSIAGRTPGMMMFGLRLAGPDGGNPGLWRAAAKTALFLMSLLTLGFAWLIALFSSEPMTSYDRLTGIRVERA